MASTRSPAPPPAPPSRRAACAGRGRGSKPVGRTLAPRWPGAAESPCSSEKCLQEKKKTPAPELVGGDSSAEYIKPECGSRLGQSVTSAVTKGSLTGATNGASVEAMIRVEGTQTAELDETVSDAVASHQRLLAMLVDGHEVNVEPDPALTPHEVDVFDELESRLYQL